MLGLISIDQRCKNVEPVARRRAELGPRKPLDFGKRAGIVRPGADGFDASSH